MTTPVPPFPGKPAQTGPKTEAWQHAICPFLTAGEIARQGPPTGLVTLGEQKQKMVAQACIGPKCMLFASLKTVNGETLSGCAPMHTLNAQMALNNMVGQFIEAAKAGAAAEAAEAERERLEEEAKNKPPETPAATPETPVATEPATPAPAATEPAAPKEG